MSEPCLHCAIMETIADWALENGERVGKNVAVDASDIIAKLAECIVDVANGAPSPKDRTDGIKFGHAAIDAISVADDLADGVDIKLPQEH